MYKKTISTFILLYLLGSQSSERSKKLISQEPLPPRPAKSVCEVIPLKLLDRMTGADIVECVLLCENWKSPCDTLPFDYRLDPYSVREHGGQLSANSRKELISVLTDSDSYLVHQTPGDVRLCGCTGHVAYLFSTVVQSRKLDRIAVIVCHDCSGIIIKGLGSKILAYVDYAADRLLELTITLFPEDSLSMQIYSRRYGDH